MNKSKKIALTLGTVATIAAPIAAVVSCGSGGGSGFNGRYDGNNDGKVLIQSTWAANQSNYRSLDTIVGKYNELKKNEPGFMPVELSHVEGTYGDIAKQAISGFEAGDKAKLPNLFVDYSTGLAAIQAYDMALDFGKLGVSRSLFDSDALEYANDTEKVDAKTELKATPLAESTQMLTADLPLMKHFITALANAGATVTPGAASTFLGKIDAYDLTANTADKTAIEPLWPTPTAGTSLSGYTVDNSTFESFEGIFEFGQKVMTLFGKHANPNADNLHVFGVDSPTSLVNLISKSLEKDASTYAPIIEKDANGYLDNKWLKDGQSKDAMMKSFDMINGSLANGSLWLGGGGDYTSNYTKEHRIAMALGSTAGWNYNFVKAATIKVVGDITVEAFKAAASKHSGALASFGHYNNPIWPSSKALTSMGNFDLKVKNSADESKITSGNYFFTAKEDPADMTKFDKVVLQKKSGDEVNYYVVKNNSDVTDSNNSAKLNETDFVAKDNVALMALKTGTDKVIIPQGPSLVGVHSNAAEDKATALFLNFLYGSATADFDGKGTMETPTVFFTKNSGYVVPMNGYTTNGSAIQTALTGNAGPLQALKTMGYLKASGVVAGTYPTGESSIPFRNQVDAALAAAKNGAHTGHAKTSADIYTTISSDIYWKN